MAIRKEKLIQKQEWEQKFLEKVGKSHKRNKDKVVQRILKRVDTVKRSLQARSKKYEVECLVTVEDLRELIYEAYGQPCKYCGKVMVINNLVIDHIMPISKGGSSNIENLQVICRTSNSMKGSLEEKEFFVLLEWLETVSPELKKDISIRLARGIH